LVTGGVGFIGAHVVRAIRALPQFAACEVAVLDDLSGGRAENLPEDPRVTLTVDSITDDDLVEELFARHRF
jgi:UDP-glucose 4-epimerase